MLALARAVSQHRRLCARHGELAARPFPATKADNTKGTRLRNNGEVFMAALFSRRDRPPAPPWFSRPVERRRSATVWLRARLNSATTTQRVLTYSRPLVGWVNRGGRIHASWAWHVSVARCTASVARGIHLSGAACLPYANIRKCSNERARARARACARVRARACLRGLRPEAPPTGSACA